MSGKIEEYWNHNPLRFKFLGSMELIREIGNNTPGPLTLTLTLLEGPSVTAPRAALRFHDVRGLKVGDLNFLFGMVFNIEDVGN